MEISPLQIIIVSLASTVIALFYIHHKLPIIILKYFFSKIIKIIPTFDFCKYGRHIWGICSKKIMVLGHKHFDICDVMERQCSVCKKNPT
jgi:hypothetical protein